MLTVLITTTLYSPKSEALVGLIFKNKIVKTIGAVGSIGGGTVAVGAMIFADSWTGLMIFVGGVFTGGLGLVILDDNELADIEFRKISIEDPASYKGFTVADVETYNSEIELLNSIRQTIVSEVSDSDNTEDAEMLWLEYSESLSPATFNIAKAKAREFVEAL